jgi:hypothetical protein
MTDFTTASLNQAHATENGLPTLHMSVAHAGIIGGDIYIHVASQNTSPGDVVIRANGGKFNLGNPDCSYHSARTLHEVISGYDTPPELPAELPLTPPPQNRNVYLPSDNLDDTSTGEPVALNIVADEDTQTFYMRTQKYGPIPKLLREHAPDFIKNRKSPWVPIHQGTTPEAYAALEKIYAEISTEQAQSEMRSHMVQALRIGGLVHDYSDPSSREALIDQFCDRFAGGREYSMF